MRKVGWIGAYIGSVVAVNVAFSIAPDLNWLWAIAVGSIFVSRDYCQRQIGHWVAAPMVVALVISYLMADPFVALASACAFAVSEATDWLVFTITKRPLKDRVLLSCGFSAPIDTAVFLGMIGILSPGLFAISVASKLVAAVILWGGYTARERVFA